MRSLILAAVMLWPSLGFTKVLNVEFKFAAYTGDVKAATVELVPGTVRVLVNNLPFADQEVVKRATPVTPEDHAITSALWVPTESLGPILRKGKNTIRIEFEPTDVKAPYRTQLRWASILDKGSKANPADKGSEDKEATGKVVLERTFDAPFAVDQPWHHLPPVTAITDADKQQMVALLKARAETFKPDFAPVYAELSKDKNLKVGEIKKLKCIESVYDAGLRISPPAVEDLDFGITGNPEVVITRKGVRQPLFQFDSAPFGKIENDEVQMCAGITMMRAFPPKMVVVRSADGKWSSPY